jgi:hypothetical protein
MDLGSKTQKGFKVTVKILAKRTEENKEERIVETDKPRENWS